jgi:hypothetical protein
LWLGFKRPWPLYVDHMCLFDYIFRNLFDYFSECRFDRSKCFKAFVIFFHHNLQTIPRFPFASTYLIKMETFKLCQSLFNGWTLASVHPRQINQLITWFFRENNKRIKHGNHRIKGLDEKVTFHANIIYNHKVNLTVFGWSWFSGIDEQQVGRTFTKQLAQDACSTLVVELIFSYT